MSNPKDVTSLTVRELIAMLEDFDGDTPVVFAYNYGDHGHTTVLGEVGQVQEEVCKWSGYHEMFYLPESDDEEANLPVVVLS